jgi:hypothetical protein
MIRGRNVDRHPTTAHWALPPDDRSPLPEPLRRVNLRELEARPLRFEHHLMVVGRVGSAQLEIATASEPLFFAHRNISDEYAVPLPSGDTMGDTFPFRTFLSAFDTGADVARINHRVGQLVLHPHGLLHWPGRLRPPFEPFEFAPGMRRTGLTLVFCASRPTAPARTRPLFVSAGLDGAVKAYTDAAVPFLLADLVAEPSRVLGVVGDATMSLVCDAGAIAPKHGAYVVVLEPGEASDAFAADLVYVPPGAVLDATGIARALVFESAHAAAELPPATWDKAPSPPFPVYENGASGTLPISFGDLHIDALDDHRVEVRIGAGPPAEVPRYWLARFLFRTALHQFQLGYLETYGGFYYDDAGPSIVFGLRGGGSTSITRDEANAVVETLYRAVAPPGYIERVV